MQMINWRRTGLGWVIFGVFFGGCDMLPADVLDAPRLLAIRATPAAWQGAAELELEALTWDVDGDALTWSLCPEVWAPTNPLSCPSAAMIALGTGNPIEVSATDLPSEFWVRVEGAGALPAVALFKADAEGANPAVTDIVSEVGAPLAPQAARASEVKLAVAFGPETDPETVVTSWYVTGGELTPPRTVGTAPTVWTMPSQASAVPLTLIGVSRAVKGGVTWTIKTLGLN